MLPLRAFTASCNVNLCLALPERVLYCSGNFGSGPLIDDSRREWSWLDRFRYQFSPLNAAYPSTPRQNGNNATTLKGYISASSDSFWFKLCISIDWSLENISILI